MSYMENIESIYTGTIFFDGVNAPRERALCAHMIQLQRKHYNYRSGTVNSKSFVGKVLLRNKWNLN